MRKILLTIAGVGLIGLGALAVFLWTQSKNPVVGVMALTGAGGIWLIWRTWGPKSEFVDAGSSGFGKLKKGQKKPNAIVWRAIPDLENKGMARADTVTLEYVEPVPLDARQVLVTPFRAKLYSLCNVVNGGDKEVLVPTKLHDLRFVAPDVLFDALKMKRLSEYMKYAKSDFPVVSAVLLVIIIIGEVIGIIAVAGG